MKLVDKVFATVVAAIMLLCTCIYTINYDMYEMVGDIRPAFGYGSLAECMKDDEWVTETWQDWGTSSSPVLQRFYHFVTDEEAPSPVMMVECNRLLMSFWCILSFACWPFYLAVKGWRVDRKRVKELLQR